VLLVFGPLKLICRGIKGFRPREALPGIAEGPYPRSRRGRVTIIVSVKFNDGIVVASDSTTAFFRESEFVQSYDNANKIFNLYKGLPIGAATCGTGGIGNASVSTLSKDLRARFQGSARGCTDWKLDPENYTVGDIARRAREFLLMAVEASEQVVSLTYWVFGYSSGRPLPELWGIYINGKDIPEPTLIAAEGASLPNWAGETEALDRLIIGRSASLVDSAVKNGMEADKATDLVIKAGSDLYEPFVLAAMPIQDAIDLAQYFVETTAGFMRFSIKRRKTVGGPVEIAAITKYEGFKWIRRKYFYDAALNP
jgi:hypothetical protein